MHNFKPNHKENEEILSLLSLDYLKLMSPITFPNMILFYLATQRFLRRSLMYATVVFVSNFRMLPPVKHILNLSRAILFQIPTQRRGKLIIWT